MKIIMFKVEVSRTKQDTTEIAKLFAAQKNDRSHLNFDLL